jgi:putative serine/threonine protein kinase
LSGKGLRLRVEDIEAYGFLLSYPRLDPKIVKLRAQKLGRMGVTHIILEGPTIIKGLHVLGKGHASIVLKGSMGEKEIAIKVLRTDSKRSSLAGEGRMLSEANSVGVGPKLLTFDDEVLITEFIDGIRLGEWKVAEEEVEVIKAVILDLLLQCRRLDMIGLDHGELFNPPKHIIIAERPVILDFESASKKRRVSNVTSLVQYLFIGGPFATVIKEKLGIEDERGVLTALRTYKRELCEGSFSSLLKALNLS